MTVRWYVAYKVRWSSPLLCPLRIYSVTVAITDFPSGLISQISYIQLHLIDQLNYLQREHSPRKCLLG